MGGVVGAVAIAVAGVKEETRWRSARLIGVVQLALVVVWQILSSSARVAWLALAAPGRLRPAIVELRLDIEDAFPALLVAKLISLTPGTVVVAWDEERRALYVHMLEAEDPDAAVRDLKRDFEEPVRRAFE